jgi:lysophospholipase L1-like esterase
MFIFHSYFDIIIYKESRKMLKELQKVWEGCTAYEEPVCFAYLKDNLLAGGELLYTPVKVLKVEAADGSSVYEEGKDYTVSGKKIIRTEHSRIPVLERDTYISPYHGEKGIEWLRLEGDAYFAKIFPEIYHYQVLVTYQHEESWKRFVPDENTAFLPRTMEMLKEKKPLKLVFYGDSITAGWEASGCDEYAIDMNTLEEFHNYSHRSPYLPAWTSLVTTALKEHFKYSEITMVNRGAGGSTSFWGYTNVEKLVNPHNPDIVVIAFGMNNLQDAPEKYKDEIMGIITRIRNQHPACEFLLVSPMVPNTETAGLRNNKLAEHEKVLYQLQESIEKVAVAPVNAVFEEILRQGKQYFDITGNGVNHPNDYSVRIYAQTVLRSLGI